MRIAFVTRDDETLALTEQAFSESFFERATSPEVVVVVGGDGTLLRAEREYPGIPKALIKSSRVGKLYSQHSANDVASALLGGNYSINEQLAIEACVHGEE